MPSRGFLFSVEKCYNGDLAWPLPLGHEGSHSSEAFAVRLEPDRTAFFYPLPCRFGLCRTLDKIIKI